jgi:hypothetical protein
MYAPAGRGASNQRALSHAAKDAVLASSRASGWMCASRPSARCLLSAAPPWPPSMFSQSAGIAGIALSESRGRSNSVWLRGRLAHSRRCPRRRRGQAVSRAAAHGPSYERGQGAPGATTNVHVVGRMRALHLCSRARASCEPAWRWYSVVPGARREQHRRAAWPAARGGARLAAQPMVGADGAQMALPHALSLRVAVLLHPARTRKEEVVARHVEQRHLVRAGRAAVSPRGSWVRVGGGYAWVVGTRLMGRKWWWPWAGCGW